MPLATITEANRVGSAFGETREMIDVTGQIASAVATQVAVPQASNARPATLTLAARLADVTLARPETWSEWLSLQMKANGTSGPLERD